MSGLAIAALLLVAALALVAWRVMPRAAWLPFAAALSLGLAGYAWQGDPAMPGADRTRALPHTTSGERIDQPLLGMVATLDRSTQWLMLADSLSRGGDTGGAAGVLAKSVKLYPQSADLWVGYGAALIAHGGGRNSRASDMAFAEARKRAPNHPGPEFFQGDARAQAGDYAGAIALWQPLIDRTTGDLPWRRELAIRLAFVRELEARRGTVRTRAGDAQ